MKKCLLFLILTFLFTTFVLCSANSNRTITITNHTTKILPNDIIHTTTALNTYKNNIEILHAYYSYPQFPDTFKQSIMLNQFYISQLYNDYKTIQELRNSALENEIPPNLSYAYDHTFEVTLLTDHFLSILENDYQYAGGAQPDTSSKAHTFSLQTGRELTLESLFIKPRADIEKQIKAYIIEEIKKHPDDYYPDAAFTISNMSLDNFQFFLNKEGITIFFNPFEISPYARGIVKFPLKFTIKKF